jgi:hypothetical protein
MVWRGADRELGIGIYEKIQEHERKKIKIATYRNMTNCHGWYWRRWHQGACGVLREKPVSI